MNNKKTIKKRMILSTLAGIAGILLFGFILMEIQSRLISRYVKDEMKESSEAILEDWSVFGLYEENIDVWVRSNHIFCLNMLNYMIEADPDLADSVEYLKDMKSVIGAEDVMIVDRSGNILCSAEGAFQDLKDESFAPLFECFDTGLGTRLYTSSEEKTEGNIVVQSDTVRTPVLFMAPLDEQRACVIYESGSMQKLFTDVSSSWKYTLSNKVIGSEGFAFAWSAETGKLLYYPGDGLLSYLDRSVSDLGIETDRIRDREFTEAKVDGKDMYLYPVYLEEQDAWIVCAVPEKELTQKEEPSRLLLWLIFGILAAAAVYYTLLLLKGKESAPGAGPRKKLLVFTVFCSLAVFACSFYLQTLYLMSRWAHNSRLQLEAIENEQNAYTDGFEAYFLACEEKPVRLVAYFIEHEPEHVSTQSLDEMAYKCQFTELHVTDENGNVSVATSSYVPEKSGSEETDNDKIDLEVPLRDKDSRIIGYVCANKYAVFLEIFMEQKNLDGILQTVRPGEGGFAFSVDQESKIFTYHPSSSLIGKNALDYGMKESDIADNLCKFIRLENENLYVTSGLSEGDLIYIAVNKGHLLRECLPVSVASTMGALILLIIIGLPLYTLPGSAENHKSERRLRIGHSREISSEYKVFRILLLGVGLVAALLVLRRFFRIGGASEGILDYVLNGNWENGFNVFALTASLLAAFEIGLVLFLLRRLVGFLSPMFSVRTVTILRMLVSLITCAGVFLMVYRSLVYFGMDPSVLMTSAGIVSVVIGIGANSLVGDILAGILMLVEGDVQIGDIVRIGEFRGRVEELGILKTKLYDIDYYTVKIIPNKEIRDVVHLSMHRAAIGLEVQISYEEDLERVENLLREELETMKKRVPELMEQPEYLGVRSLGDNGVALFVWLICHEFHRPKVTREVTRYIYKMFCRNGIEVPYPQVQLHQDPLE